MRNPIQDLQTLSSHALPLSHRDSTVSKVYYKVHMTRILQIAKISNVDSVMFVNRIREMVNFEHCKEIEKNVFCHVKSVGQRKKFKSPWEIEPQTFEFCIVMLYHWATEILQWARSIMKSIWHVSCILLGSAMLIASAVSDPNSMQDMCHMNFVIDLIPIESLWLSGRASEHGIQRSEVRFLMGTWIFSLSHAHDMTKNIFLYFFTKLRTYHLSYSIYRKKLYHNLKYSLIHRF